MPRVIRGYFAIPHSATDCIVSTSLLVGRSLSGQFVEQLRFSYLNPYATTMLQAAFMLLRNPFSNAAAIDYAFCNW